MHIRQYAMFVKQNIFLTNLQHNNDKKLHEKKDIFKISLFLT